MSEESEELLELAATAAAPDGNYDPEADWPARGTRARSSPERFEPPRARKKARKSKAPKSKEDVAARSCPHCDKVISTPAGLKYHLDHKVCFSKDGRPLPAKSAGRKRKFNKIRGSKEDRSCPLCKRVFTSVLGAEYHKKHRVCQSKAGKDPQARVPVLPVLPAGSEYLSPYGPVRVLRDDRAIPTATLVYDKKHASNMKVFTNSRIKRDRQVQSLSSKVYIQNYSRRHRINEVYESGNVSKAAVFNAYFGQDPSEIEDEVKQRVAPKPNALAEDPSMPRDSFPNRMVECVLIPDRRNRVYGGGSDDSVIQQIDRSTFPEPATSMKLFVQRHLLVAPYQPDAVVYSCAECSSTFTSEPGLKYHVNRQACSIAGEKAKDERAARLERYEKELSKASKPPKVSVPRTVKLRRKRTKEVAIYPEALLSLGYRMALPDNIESEMGDDNEDDASHGNGDDSVAEGDDIRLVAASLRNVLDGHMREASDQRLGSMYQEVYLSLGFKDPANIPKLPKQKRKRRKTKPTPKPEPPKKPLPTIVDVSALLDELQAGRYPSLVRHDGDHDDECGICKQSGKEKVLCCDYCTTSVHMSCQLTRWTVKVPEPGEDFLCHRCIGQIVTRRNRAEKRRKRKKGITENDEDDDLDNTEIDGHEYEHLARRGQELQDLVDLLNDAEIRLDHTLKMMPMNDCRRLMLA